MTTKQCNNRSTKDTIDKRNRRTYMQENNDDIINQLVTYQINFTTTMTSF